MTFTLEKQTGTILERGEQESYIVVKQSIFTLTVSSSHRIDGNVECELVYDKTNKPVEFISTQPITYKIIQITQNTINIDCKINVLSSSYEDSLFKVLVKLTVLDQVISSLLSNPIKVASKIDPARGNKQKQQSKAIRQIHQ